MWLEESANVAEGAPERVNGSGFGFAQVCLDLGEGLLNRVHVRTIRGQEQELGAVSIQALGGLFTFVSREVVEDHHIPLVQRRRELRLDVRLKRLTSDRAIDDPWRTQLMAAQPGQKSMRLPVAEGRAHAQARHLGVDVGFVEKDQAMRLLAHARLTVVAPDPTLIPHVGACALRRH